MDKNKIFVAGIVFIVIFGGFFAVKMFQDTPVVAVIPNTPDALVTTPVEDQVPVVDTSAPNHPLLGTKWEWIRTDYLSGPSTIPVKERFILSFDVASLQLSSTTDCNSISSKYLIDGEVLSIGPIASTEMACPGPTLEEKYTQEIGRTLSYVITGDELKLNLWRDTGTMIFSKK